MFQEPDEAIARDAAAKLDRAAATQRSTIRRQPTVRPSRYNPEAALDRLRWAEERHRAMTRQQDEEEMNAELQIRQMQAEIARLRNRRGSRREHGANLRDAEALVEQSRAAFPDDENQERSESRPARRFHLPRPNRESSLRFEVSAPRSGSASPNRLRLLSPPSSSGSGRNVPDGPLLDGESPPALTQGFAPAHSRGDDLRSLETPPPETWESSLPPLDRWSGRPERPSQRSIDGLGDRHRSPSPDRNAEEENWANLLSTMEPRHSSTTTSFASNFDYGSNARNSQSTVATSFGEIATDDGCDNDLPPGITEEDARHIREQHRARDRQRRRNGEPDGPIMTGEQGLRMHEARLRRARDEAREGSRQIQMIQQIMERFGSREDLPDDWWTIVGWDDDVGSEPRRESSRPRRPAAEHRRTPESRPESQGEPHEGRVSRTLQQADEIMRELRSQGSQEII
jgi:hypothetical protein